MSELVESVRTPGDSWAITESVGATALGVAAARAAETSRPDPLIRDPFAYLLVSAAGPEWAEMASGVSVWHGDDERGRRIDEMSHSYQAVRTHYFDEYFGAAARAGIRQVVLLAAGLDSRAYRLNWPSGTVVFEIDQPKVLEYKTATLDSHGAVASADRRAVDIDLRDDWASALVSAGFDAARPTAWLAEGLLPYLPADAQDRLFEIVTLLSAVGSRIAVEAFDPYHSRSDEQRAAWRERAERLRQQFALDNDLEALIYQEPHRSDAASWLGEHGWQVAGVDSRQEMARLGRPVPDDLSDAAVASTLLWARLDTADPDPASHRPDIEEKQ
ncbi:MAG: class I SAM-dependent methyltransferase [Mycobacteriaceae bacterium]|nr:class I SAM-dependent methyltransferase [Mycobacteriaceae bacterium]